MAPWTLDRASRMPRILTNVSALQSRYYARILSARYSSKHKRHSQKPGPKLGQPPSPLILSRPVENRHNPKSPPKEAVEVCLQVIEKLRQIKPDGDDLALTRPPRLDLPEKDVKGNSLAYYYGIGRAYLRFYKTGLKQVWTCVKAYRKYAKIKRSELDILTVMITKPAIDIEIKKSPSLWTWNRMQFVNRARGDVRKLAPFGLLLLICGEFTPVVMVAFGSSITPLACKIPRQILKDRIRLLTRIHRYDKSNGDEATTSWTGPRTVTSKQILPKVDFFRFWDRFILFFLPVLSHRLQMDLLTRSTLKIDAENLRLIRGANLLLRQGAVQSVPDEEIINLCFELGHLGPKQERALFHLVKGSHTSDERIVDLELDLSPENMQHVRTKLARQIQRGNEFVEGLLDLN